MTLGTSGGAGVTVNVGGSYSSGGFVGATSTAADAGLIKAYNSNFTNCGGVAVYCIFSQPTNAVTVWLDTNTFCSSGKVGIGNPGATAIVHVINNRLGTTFGDACASSQDATGHIFEWGGNGNYATIARTTGTRIVANNYFQGSVLLTSYTPSLGAAFDAGLTFGPNVIYQSSATIPPLIMNASSGTIAFSGTEWQPNLIYSSTPQTGTYSTPVMSMPQGTLTAGGIALKDLTDVGVTTQVCTAVDRKSGV